MTYTSFLTVIKSLGVENGDILLVSSDITDLMLCLKKNEGISDPNRVIDLLQEAVGCEGTLLFPTYNWDFCKGVPFDYYKTPSRTGALSSFALKRKDFKRTKHPIYSFAVWGKYRDYLYSLENTDSFGQDSPFDFLYKKHGKNIIINVEIENSFTFTHYVEESVGVCYRYIKHFLAEYIDEQSNKEKKQYSMYVRDLELNPEKSFETMEHIFEEKGAAVSRRINDIPFLVVDLYQAFYLIKDDIQNNAAKNIVFYKGQ